MLVAFRRRQTPPKVEDVDEVGEVDEVEYACSDGDLRLRAPPRR